MPKPASQTNGNQPVHTVRHRNIKAAIWKNQSDKGENYYNVSVTRSYRDGEEWRDSNSFGYDDLMNLAAVLYEAHGFISSLRAKDYADDRAKPTADRRQRNSA